MTADASKYVPNEAFAEAADAFDGFGSRVTALSFLDKLGIARHKQSRTGASRPHDRARMAIRRRDVEAARDAELKRLSAREPDTCRGVGFIQVGGGSPRGYRGDLSATGMLLDVRPLPRRRMAQPPLGVWATLAVDVGGRRALNQTLAVVHNSAPWHLTYLAEDLAAHLPRISPRSLDLVAGGCSPAPRSLADCAPCDPRSGWRRPQSARGATPGSDR